MVGGRSAAAAGARSEVEAGTSPPGAGRAAGTKSSGAAALRTRGQIANAKKTETSSKKFFSSWSNKGSVRNTSHPCASAPGCSEKKGMQRANNYARKLAFISILLFWQV